MTCVKHVHYKCSIHVLQVYELHVYQNTIHVLHTGMLDIPPESDIHVVLFLVYQVC